jgi:hypothetical protein
MAAARIQNSAKHRPQIYFRIVRNKIGVVIGAVLLKSK